MHVVVVCSAVAAETAAAVADGGVWKEDSHAVVIARYSHRCQLCECFCSWIKQLRRVYRIGVAERDCISLAAGNKNGAVGEDDAVGEGARVGHVAYCSDGGVGVWGAESDYVGVRGGIGVLVVRCAAYCEDFAGDGVVHGCVAALGGFVSYETIFWGQRDGAVRWEGVTVPWSRGLRLWCQRLFGSQYLMFRTNSLPRRGQPGKRRHPTRQKASRGYRLGRYLVHHQ